MTCFTQSLLSQSGTSQIQKHEVFAPTACNLSVRTDGFRLYRNRTGFLTHTKGTETAMIRIGHGYDVHRLVNNRKLILGGVDIPHVCGLLGHSDADVLVHAILDSLLGALALGDIGKHFPDNDDNNLGADSLVLARHVANMIKENGYRIVNIDSTVIAQAPKLAPYTEMMRRNISAALAIDISQISVKATTEEKLGFTGEELGIAAHAVCLLESI